MEIGASSNTPTLKTKFISAFISGASFTGIMYFINGISEDQQTGIYYLVQGVVFGLFMGFLMPYFMQKFGSRLGNKLNESILDSLDQNETLEFEGPANLFRGIEGVGGKLFITNKKLIFAAHKLNIQKGQTYIPYDEITSVSPRKTAKLIDNGLRINTIDSKEFDFVVNDREQWIELINQKIA